MNLRNEFKFVFNLVSKGQYTLYISVVEKVSYLIIFAILARVANTSEYGLIITIFAFSNILTAFLNLGLGINIQKEVSLIGEDINDILSNTFFIKLISFPIFIGIMFVYLNVFLDVSNLFLIIPLAVYLASFQEILNRGLYGQTKFKQSFLALVASRLFLLALIGTIFFFNPNHFYILAGYLAGILFYQFLLSKTFVDLTGFKIQFSFDPKMIKKIMLNSFPLGIGIFSVFVYDKVDVVVIQSFLSNELVAFYAIAYSIYKIPSIVPGVVLIPFFSNIVESFKKNRVVDKKQIIFIGISIFILSLLVGLLVYSFSDLLIKIIYGDQFAVSKAYLIVLVIALPGLFLNNFTGTLLNAVNMQKNQAIGTTVGVCVNLLLLFLLIDVYGVWAAVFSTIVSEFLVFFIQLLFILKYREILFSGNI
ncbi:membrane protein [hydrocarbon metagenome]|uniref:Membrane protein n=1 Tax=hydrocarbon metagenome TaxID=938273 RepID=A0A0W8FW27_9ZZZZ